MTIKNPLKNIELTTSQLASSILSLKGKQFSLKGYEPFKEIYDTDPPIMTLRCSRQIGKSVSMGALMTAKSIATSFFNSLYIAPLSQQASRFSTLYLKGFFDSPLVKKYYRNSESLQNVFEKSLSNGSRIFLGYAQTESDSDRIRGVACDSVSFDEAADIALDALDIIKETTSASEYGYIRNFGTPKSSINTLETLFKRGNGLEWCCKCESCNKWNIPWDSETCIKMCRGETGPVCAHCGKPIDITKGKWVAARPNVKDHYSFHIPRFVLPSRLDPRKWADIKSSIKNYTPAKLDNEVFGISSGLAGRILSYNEVFACCNPSIEKFDDCWPMDSRGIVNVVLGVDWSVSGGVASYTVATVLGYDYMGKCFVIYSERMQGVDILSQVRRVEHLYRKFNVQMIGSDQGCGRLQFELLRGSLGPDKVIPIQYCAAKTHLRYDKQGGFLAADRTMAIDQVVLKMKLGRLKFETPRWDYMETYWKDALSVFEEESKAGRRLYRKDEGSTDDWLHSIVFGHSAWMCVTGQYNFQDQLSYDSEDDLVNTGYA